MEFVLELGLGAFGAGADGFGVVAVECTRGFGVVSIPSSSFSLALSSSAMRRWSGNYVWE